MPARCWRLGWLLFRPMKECPPMPRGRGVEKLGVPYGIIGPATFLLVNFMQRMIEEIEEIEMKPRDTREKYLGVALAFVLAFLVIPGLFGDDHKPATNAGHSSTPTTHSAPQ